MRPLRALWLALLGPALGAAADGPYELISIPPDDARTVAAELVDLDGDARSDLLRFAFSGVPPDERRRIHVHLQGDAGLPASPSFSAALPPGAAAYDLGDVLPGGGIELVLLQPDGVSIVSLAAPDAPRRRLQLDGATIGAAVDEQGLPRTRLVRPRLGGARPRLLVPLLRQLALLEPDGRELARLEISPHARIWAPEPGAPLAMGSDLHLMLRAPHVSIADVDGDARVDVITLGRHEARVFLARESGFRARPDRVLPLRRVSERDHVRGTGVVRGDARDVDGDGRADLLLSYASGNLSDAHTRTELFLGGPDGWQLDAPDASFTSAAQWSMEQLLDVDGDGRLELVRVGIPVSVLELAEMLITRAADVHVIVHRASAGGVLDPEPWLRRKLGVPISFETGSTRGFMPTFGLDLDGDGRRDLLGSGAGDAIEIRPLRADGRLGRVVRQELPTAGVLRHGDLDGDGLPDLLIFDPRDPAAAVRIARRRGDRPELRPRDPADQ